MNNYYGWTYAGQLASANKRKQRNAGLNYYHKPSSAKGGRLNLISRLDLPKAARIFGRTGRLLAAGILITLTLLVTSQEVLQAEVTGRVAAWWQGVKIQLGREHKAGQLISTRRQGTGFSPQPGVACQTKADSSPASETCRIKPWALISDQGLFILDGEGKIGPGVTAETLSLGLPVITGIRIREEPGVMGVELKAKLGMDFIRGILTSSFADQLSEIHFSQHQAVTIFTRDAIKIRMLNHRNLERDLSRLGAVLGDIRVKKKQIALIDLRYDQQVVVRPKKGR